MCVTGLTSVHSLLAGTVVREPSALRAQALLAQTSPGGIVELRLQVPVNHVAVVWTRCGGPRKRSPTTGCSRLCSMTTQQSHSTPLMAVSVTSLTHQSVVGLSNLFTLLQRVRASDQHNTVYFIKTLQTCQLLPLVTRSVDIDQSESSVMMSISMGPHLQWTRYRGLQVTYQLLEHVHNSGQPIKFELVVM